MKKKKLSTSLDLKMNGLVVHVMGQINLLYIQQPLFASGPWIDEGCKSITAQPSCVVLDLSLHDKNSYHGSHFCGCESLSKENFWFPHFLTMEALRLQCCFPARILTQTHLNNGLQIIFTKIWKLEIIKQKGVRRPCALFR